MLFVVIIFSPHPRVVIPTPTRPINVFLRGLRPLSNPQIEWERDPEGILEGESPLRVGIGWVKNNVR
jgi:hypothetical protein